VKDKQCKGPLFFALFDVNQPTPKYISSLWRRQFIYLVGIKRNILDSILPRVFTENQFHDVRTA